MKEELLNKISELVLLFFTLLAKYAGILLVSAFSAIMDIYNKKKQLASWGDRLFAFVFKVGFGSSIMIAVSQAITNHILLIVLTSVITIGGEEIAVWIGLNIKTGLTAVLDILVEAVRKIFKKDES